MKKILGLIKNVVLVLFVLAVIGAALGGGSKDKGSRSSSQASAEQANEATAPAEEAPAIEYLSVSVDDLIGVLKNNPMNAKNTYEGTYVRVTGSLTNIDASGEYFSIDNGDEWSFDSIHCSMDDEATRNRIASASMGDWLTVCGQITSVGEVLGYSMDVDYIE